MLQNSVQEQHRFKQPVNRQWDRYVVYLACSTLVRTLSSSFLLWETAVPDAFSQAELLPEKA